MRKTLLNFGGDGSAVKESYLNGIRTEQRRAAADADRTAWEGAPEQQTDVQGGVRKRNQASYTVKEFRLFDRVEFRGSLCFVTGRRTGGYFALRTLDGAKVHEGAKAAGLTLLEMRKGYIQDRQFLSALQKTGSSCRIMMKGACGNSSPAHRGGRLLAAI